MVDWYLLPVVVGINVILGLWTYRSSKAKSALLFCFTVLSLVFWTISNFLADHSTNALAALLWTRLTFVSTSFLAYFFFCFALFFPKTFTKRARTITEVLAIPMILMVVLSLTNLFVAKVTQYSWGVNVGLGPLSCVHVLAVETYS